MAILTVNLQFRCFIALCVVIIYQCKLVASNQDISVTKENTTLGNLYSLRSVVNALKDAKYKNNAPVQTLLKLFEEKYLPVMDKYPPRIFPLIVVESSMRSPRRILSELVAKTLNAEFKTSVPKAIKNMQYEFSSDATLKRLFFTLGLFMTSCRINKLLTQSVVVLNGYWLDQVTFLISRTYKQDLPPRGSILYRYPKNIAVPDITVFYNPTNKESRLSPKEWRAKNRVTEVYRRMIEPMYELNSSFITDNDVQKIKDFIIKSLSDKYAYLPF